ncbi:MAG: SPFH domain-containing protein [Lachnospiraceae bacterium]|nr:SPFH domain-containing protein [Lachnospiraceae bacterium]
MGLIAAALNAVGGNLADQWKEFFYCDAISKDTLVVRGQKKVNGRSSNTKGDDNVITNGSGIAVADGQCMIIVEDGKVVEVCAQPGNFTYDTSLAPSVFTGNLWQSIKDTFSNIGSRIAYGGIAGHDQRVYYFNTKEILDNKIGTPAPVPFRVVDKNVGLDIDINIRCNGIYSYRIADPLLFYTNVCGNVSGNYGKDQIDSQIKSELLSALQPAFARISEMGIRYSALPAHTTELRDALKECLKATWAERLGIELMTFNVNSVNANPEDVKMIQDLQRRAALRDPSMAAATLVDAQSNAMQDAAKNAGGAMNGFIGLNMAQNAGGMNATDLFNMAQRQPAAAPAAAPAPAADSWTCSCGAVNTGKFCMECGTPKPAPAASWTCSCGAVNTGKFCMECGSPKPVSDEWTCSCGTVNKGKFCMNCGSPRA